MKMKKKNFTLFELLISVGLLVVLSVVLLRTMVLTADYWHHSNEQSNLYLDSKVVFNMMSEEIAGMIYDYRKAGDEKYLFAPVYFQDTAFATGAPGFNLTGGDVSHGKALYFVTHTRRANPDDSTENVRYNDICKVVYKYFPPLKGPASGYGVLNSSKVPGRGKTGAIVRGVKADSSFKANQGLSAFFNIADADLQEVITGVIDFQIHFYKKESSGTLTRITSAPSASKGYEDLAAIRVSMTLLPENRIEEFRRDYLTADADKQKDYLLKYSRTFIRTFWVNPMSEIKEGE